MLPRTYLVGGASALVTITGQRLGDLAANTVVIREREHEEPDFGQIAAARYNSLLAHPDLGGALRSLAEPKQSRWHSAPSPAGMPWPHWRASKSFASSGITSAELVPFPKSALEGLTDEQYVRSVVGVIYNPVRPLPTVAAQ